MKVALGSDHAGFELKESLKSFLSGLGVEWKDMGPYTPDSVDYPDYAEKVARMVLSGEAERGLLVCGTGLGMCIAANRFPGIRAVQASDPDLILLSRQHNNANVLCLSGRFTPVSLAKTLVTIWLETPFEGGRHQRRVDKMDHLNIQT